MTEEPAGAGETTSSSATRYFPPLEGDSWGSVSPAELGWESEALTEAIAFAGRSNSSGLVILHRGMMVAEHYWGDGSTHAAGTAPSVQKSLVSLLVGQAQYEGYLRLDDVVANYLGEGWSRSAGTEAEITIRHLITMTSGLTNGPEQPAKPGTLWRYNTRAYQMVKRVVEVATGLPLEEYTRTRLWDPIGCRDSRWQERPNMPFTAWVTSTRDMARLGLFVLAGGRWDGATVFPDGDYLRQATSASAGPESRLRLPVVAER